MQFDKLSNLCMIQIGKTPSRQVKRYWGKGFPWVAISDLKKKYICKTKEQITQIAIDETNCKVIPKGTLLMSFKLSIGKLAFSKCNLFTNEAIVGITLKNKKILNKHYLYYALKNIPLLKGAKVAVKGNTLNKKSLGNLQIPLPKTLDEQVKIANLLTQVEVLIAKREESIKLLDELLRSTFLDMFGDPVLNPKHLKKIKISTFSEVKTGSTPSRSKLDKYYKDGQYNWVKTTEVKNKKIYDTEEKITLDAINETNCKLLPKYTVLIAMYGQGVTRGRVGFLMKESATNQACAGIIPNNKFDSIFLFYQLQYLYRNLRKLGRGGGRPNLNLNIIKNYKVITPIIEDNPNINKFTPIVKQVELAKEKYQDSLKELNELFSSLSQKAFQGKLDLSKIELITNKLEDKPLENKVYEPKLTNVETVNIKSTPIKNLETYIFDLIKRDDFSIEKTQHYFGYDDVKKKIFEMLEEKKIKQNFDTNIKGLKLVVSS